MKSRRQEALTNLINNNSITTQEELLAGLRKLGFEVTQATVSRDIRELKISKISQSDGSFRYVTSKHANAPKSNTLGLNSALTESILKIDHACNDIVVHTLPGLAQAIAAAIDSIHIDGILGCVAGDDTILIITRGEKDADDISLRLSDMLVKR